MSNVASFDEFDTDLEIDAHSRGLPRIILEGATDVWLFRDVWFTNYMAKFEFISASRLVDGDGCTAVPAAVEKSWNEEIPAFGILDRDVYFRRKVWDALYEPEEIRFRTFETNDNVFVSELWEIEAHLILPEVLTPWVIGCSRDPIRFGHLAADALQRALVQCDILFEAAPYLAAMHSDGKAATSSFGELPLEQVRDICANRLSNLSTEANQQAQVVANFVIHVRDSAPDEPAARLRYYLKFIDTKRLLDRLRNALRLTTHHNNHQMLAGFMSQRAYEPEEFKRHLAHLIERVGPA
ncbi:hypothetical protein [Mesorhizobium sp.]|uniref:hypothetical protein n=1 Tax=Mesorhizobium sp. TaxID=1871066 RepID=UPI000FE86A9C|nr:hypothetical protein [Mesorhizobium sp.]TGQ62660.1 hypothetical protein EN848_32500 [bacterium M00.F.Ca.ET.205.01.1.1]TGU45684.1 hypothetical protein EN795_33295 [bacterium M00.F.Ca.ET.152.01.1.1]TGV31485.1 hypothetical protein EN829_032625 [Mesorhizobium sp. M00.F.Ca.ET.186.01.1.1]TGZ38693.1 hypothetical protein EN805_32445 [bacterium M00.F.Ca.ET.162.01.1.1]RWA59265.1 MAG: hypothetical protein EOQ29_34190 [Mesorhizobium sp.]